MNFLFIKKLILFVCSSLILLWAAFYNGYPILFVGDSFGYYHYGLKLDHDTGAHSFLYGLFVAGFSFHHTFWTVAFIQCFIVSIILFETIKVFSGNEPNNRIFILIILTLSVFTSLTKYTGKIMPDIFTGLIMMCFYLLMFGKYSKRNQAILIVSIALFLCFHTSFVFIFLLFSVGYMLFLLVNKEIKRYYKKVLIMIFLCISPFVTVYFTHSLILKNAYYSKCSHIYLMAKLSDMGILKKYLDDNCSNSPNILCNYKNEIINLHNFMYNPEVSPTIKEFGTNAIIAHKNSKELYNRIIFEILSSPKYGALFLFQGILNTFHYFVNFQYFEQSGGIMTWHFDNYLPYQKSFYLHSKQFLNQFIDYEKLIHITEFYFVIISLFFLLLTIRIDKKSLSNHQFHFLIMVILCIVSNNFVCGLLAEVVARFSQRIIWIIPLTAILFFVFSETKGQSFGSKNIRI
jgi:hypothetical protein